MRTMQKNNLISLLDVTFPDANKLFSSPPRADGSEKWVDFVAQYWHCECVCGMSEKAFTKSYEKWCRKHGYNFSEDKALDVYASACGHICIMPKCESTKLMIQQAVALVYRTAIRARRPESPAAVTRCTSIPLTFVSCWPPMM